MKTRKEMTEDELKLLGYEDDIRLRYSITDLLARRDSDVIEECLYIVNASIKLSRAMGAGEHMRVAASIADAMYALKEQLK